MKRAVVVITDGLRADMVTPELTPEIRRVAEGGTRFTHHRSVYPSTTRTTSASIATGCLPGRHGLEGNCVALDAGDGLKAYNVGHPGFRDVMRAATGQTLRVPTLAERVKDAGGAVVFSNVSAGAAYFQDPDGFGHLYHRQGSFAPGLAPVTGADGLDVSHDADGDAAMTERFCAEVLARRRPALALLWQCEPDHTQHAVPLGSPEHLAVVARADENVGRVADAVAETAGGDDILFIAASDHGHETVERVVPLDAMLIEAGLKDGPDSTDVVVASNAFSAHVYVADEARDRVAGIVRFLETADGVGAVFAGEDLARVGHRADGALAVTVSAERTDRANDFGVPGMSAAFADPLSKETRLGCGQHGGLGPYEQGPFLAVMGGGFGAGAEIGTETSAVDLAPTILRHLDLPADGMDGKPLPQG